MSLTLERPCQVSTTASNTRSTAPSQESARSTSGARNMMAATELAPSLTKKRTCSPVAPTAAAERMVTPRTARSGFLLPWPKGRRRSRPWTTGIVSSSRVTTQATSPTEANCSGGRAESSPERRSRNSGRRSAGRVTPTAPAWPPNRVRRSEQPSTAWKRSTDPTDLPDPRASPSATENSRQGTW